MTSPTDPEPDPKRSTRSGNAVLKVGQDRAGHWLVQQSGGTLEGRFISFAAAMAFARSEAQMLPGATIVRMTTPIMPIVPFAPVEPWETTVPHRKAA